MHRHVSSPAWLGNKVILVFLTTKIEKGGWGGWCRITHERSIDILGFYDHPFLEIFFYEFFLNKRGEECGVPKLLEMCVLGLKMTFFLGKKTNKFTKTKKYGCYGNMYRSISMFLDIVKTIRFQDISPIDILTPTQFHQDLLINWTQWSNDLDDWLIWEPLRNEPPWGIHL